MLGCQDFCGYYEWTFHYVRRRWGADGFVRLLHDSIGGDSQGHYVQAGLAAGLRGLYECWVKTGHEEHCDWTFTLDEEKNILRSDMRKCPSKGFLTQHDLNADEDYCNHCAGWVIPMLQSVGAELLEHEHNHCGQCWFTMRMKDRPCQPLELDIDIRRDPRWNQGYLDRWANNKLLPLALEISASGDPCAVLEALFSAAQPVNFLDDTTPPAMPANGKVLATDAAYNNPAQCPGEPWAVLLGCPPADLAATAARFLRTPAVRRPFLLHPYLPGVPFVDFVSAGLPRPLPILPFLIRAGQYTHHPGGPHPTTAEFLALLAAAWGKTGVIDINH